MKTLFISIIALFAISSCNKKCECPDKKADNKAGDQTAKAGDKGDVPMTTDLATADQKLSYFTGYNLVKHAQRFNTAIDISVLNSGFNEAKENKPPRVSQQEIQQIMMQLQQKAMASANNPASNPKALENEKAGNDFLAKNKTVTGVKETASGLQYQVITEGKGDKPAATDKVRVHYKGTLLDGREFDSSYKRNQPTEFPVNQVIAGWTEAIQLMPVGSKWKLWIPGKLAYGSRKLGIIEPMHLLVFEVELLGIVGKDAPKTDAMQEAPKADAMKEAPKAMTPPPAMK